MITGGGPRYARYNILYTILLRDCGYFVWVVQKSTGYFSTPLREVCKINYSGYGDKGVGCKGIQSTSFQKLKWSQIKKETTFDTFFWYSFSCPVTWYDPFFHSVSFKNHKASDWLLENLQSENGAYTWNKTNHTMWKSMEYFAGKRCPKFRKLWF